ncbi:hypothetical protein [Nostoc sp. TCL240-02]|uniref:hypothetical protein n=1 Tax=Nostoc sp. TCL240-02 TaxID=2572090 RepID=UPI00157FA70D|nr:hypothetical protein [Nostoc sp. TCL240-02]QKQ75647.1 hypothetical protein FBB35_22230 [Nostoc sp. TCL240-02]
MSYTPRQSAEITRNYTKKYVDRALLTVEDRIVAAIESDICDRRSLKFEWRHIPDDVVEEILEVWREIVRQEIGVSTPEFSVIEQARQIKVLAVQLENKLRTTANDKPADIDTAPHTHNPPQAE